jgi:hypothetical protein
MKYEYMDWVDAKKNLNRQGTKVLHYIVDVYQRGELDNPDDALNFCSLLACICEGKVTGLLDKEEMRVNWSLKPEYEKKMHELYDAFIEVSEQSPNVIKGPWSKK